MSSPSTLTACKLPWTPCTRSTASFAQSVTCWLGPIPLVSALTPLTMLAVTQFPMACISVNKLQPRQDPVTCAHLIAPTDTSRSVIGLMRVWLWGGGRVQAACIRISGRNLEKPCEEGAVRLRISRPRFDHPAQQLRRLRMQVAPLQIAWHALAPFADQCYTVLHGALNLRRRGRHHRERACAAASGSFSKHCRGCIHTAHLSTLHHCTAEALKQAYQTAVSKLQSQFQRQLQEIELRVHSQHHSSTGPVSVMHAQLEQVKEDNASLQVC